MMSGVEKRCLTIGSIVLPEVLLKSAPAPVAVFWSPVLLKRAPAPMAVLKLPVVLLKSVRKPAAVLKPPLLRLRRASSPLQYSPCHSRAGHSLRPALEGLLVSRAKAQGRQVKL